MEIVISQNQDMAPVTIMKLRGALDGESYQDFVK